MREESVSRRYAAAFFESSQRSGTVAESQADMITVVQTLIADPKLVALLRQPLVTERRKKEALKEALETKIRRQTLGFLNLLVDKRRINLLAEVEEEFTQRVRASNNVALASAVSAIPLSTTEAEALRHSLEGRTGKTIELVTSVDASLIGGILVRIGDTVYDGSVRGNLLRLREQLLAAR
ncbi:MAG: F0F1 ATP synthase subunit delta [Cytophagales bacterium]|nr:F0F1 ATP synthase subunit delta [Armatimonadota bacterium]